MTFKHNIGKDFQVLERVPENKIVPGLADNLFTIIDLETTGLNYKTDNITEIGIIQVAYSRDLSNVSVINVYQEFNDPGVEISTKITKLTGITSEMVKDRKISWDIVQRIVEESDFVICHNAAFDRKFLEQTQIGELFKNTVFACFNNDIDWKCRVYGSDKLDYLNWKLWYFYVHHRAINDCWATLNILTQEEGALAELIENTKDEYEVYALNAPYSSKDILKHAGFFWNTGENGKPKAWYKKVKELGHVTTFLQENRLPAPKIVKLPANKRYSSEV